ncbi:hypothetical protein HYN59_09610 [Flavobacterium album]|uniref:Uncharacterized protein n=1 Tax=Flavobacterium album TaxID=2175091 RepID=A0A2S1QYA5_9FLAO|nr:hypothetical protein [Flavobacterium album]AWH85354.1 hypothetical protein HYN59_09610 [Flavobacterium album]
MKKTAVRTLLLFFLLSANYLKAQDAVFTFTIKDSIKLRSELKVAIGKNMSLRDFTVGDITADKKPDIIAITSPENKEGNRKICLFICESGSNYKLAAINTTLIECEVCGGMGVGDPYQRTVIKNNYFSFELLFGACDKDLFTITFKYDPKKKWWFLHKDVTESYNCHDGEDGEVKITTEINHKEGYGVTRFENY